MEAFTMSLCAKGAVKAQGQILEVLHILHWKQLVH